MKNIKTFDSLDEAFAYKPIYPDYDLQYDDYRAGIMSYVRKQDDKGVWYLIPITMRYEFALEPEKEFEEEREINKIHRTKDLLNLIKRFNVECYKILLFWKFPQEQLISPMGKPIGGEVDSNQESERDRLMPKLSKNTLGLELH